MTLRGDEAAWRFFAFYRDGEGFLFGGKSGNKMVKPWVIIKFFTIFASVFLQ